MNPQVRRSGSTFRDGQTVAIGRQTREAIGTSLREQRWRVSCLIQPRDRHPLERSARSIHKGPVAIEVELSEPDRAVTRYIQESPATSVRLQPNGIERYGVERPLGHVNQVAALQVPGVHASPLQNRPAAA